MRRTPPPSFRAERARHEGAQSRKLPPFLPYDGGKGGRFLAALGMTALPREGGEEACASQLLALNPKAPKGMVRVDEIFLAKIFHFYSHSVPNGTGDGGGGALFLPTFRP
jgi:hypothetical protein